MANKKPDNSERKLKLGHLMIQYHIGTPAWVECAVIVQRLTEGAEIWAYPVKGSRSPKQLRAGDLYCARWVVPEKKSLREEPGAVLWPALRHSRSQDNLFNLIAASETCRQTRGRAQGVYGKDHKILSTLDAELDLFWDQLCTTYDEVCKDEKQFSADYMRHEAMLLEERVKRLKTEMQELTKRAAGFMKSAAALAPESE